MTASTQPLDHAINALAAGRPAEADRLLSTAEAGAFAARDVAGLKAIWPALARARRERRRRAAAGRIDLHTHTTASDGAFTVEQSLCEHFKRGQILIDDHNIIDSLAEARRLVRERDLELDVFLGIEVICQNERRAFEFHAIAPKLSDGFLKLCAEHRAHWDRAAELFLADLSARDDFFDDPRWRPIIEDHELGGSFAPVIERFEEVRRRVNADPEVYRRYLRNSQTFDMGNLWGEWKLSRPGDPPQLAHRFFGSARCYAMNQYRGELGDWFDYESLAGRFKAVGCVVSHNHPNYWDEDFIGELPHTLQEKWIRDWAARGVIDALEVWSPPFASKRVPHYWEKVCRECGLIPMAGTDCHNGKEESIGGKVENHPEIPPQLYAKLSEPAAKRAREGAKGDDAWAALGAWREVLEIDYAHEEGLTAVEGLVGKL